MTVVVNSPCMADSVEADIVSAVVEKCDVLVCCSKPKDSKESAKNELAEELKKRGDVGIAKPRVEEVSVFYQFNRQRTQKIGVGAIFNSEKPNEEIELVEQLMRKEFECDSIGYLPFYASDRCVASLFPGYETIEEEFNILMPSNERAVNAMVFEKSTANVRSSFAERALPATLTVPSRAKRGRSPTGVVVELEIEAGEEVANTEALVDVAANSFEEVSLDITEFSSDVLDVDVTMEAVMEEEDIEAVGPAFYTQVRDFGALNFGTPGSQPAGDPLRKQPGIAPRSSRV
ncbi:unnamed protein product [Toxocara canis]|uniref:NPL domain-containing protein n=1 Tax=Toxocara canis TaxID=6265 RepID=A0A183UT62_TOXCA|nr:unnamed protein product [Toxocara canis]